jgi:hypothetical protein
MTPLAGLRSDGGVILREAEVDGALRVERWTGSEWVPTKRAVWDFDFIPLATHAELRAAGL